MLHLEMGIQITYLSMAFLVSEPLSISVGAEMWNPFELITTMNSLLKGKNHNVYEIVVTDVQSALVYK